MYLPLILISEIVVLYLLSKTVSQKLFRALPLTIYQVLFLPGIFVHELSHFLVAKILGVKVTKFSVLPSRREDGFTLGHVEIEKSGIIRNMLVSIAPTILGVIVIIISSHLLLPNTNNLYVSVVYVAILLEVIHTMFISKQDLRIAWVGLVLVTSLVILTVVWGHISLDWLYFENIFGKVISYFGLAIGLDLFFIVILRLLKILKNSFH